MKFHLINFLLLFSSLALAQQKYTISGYVKDASNGEALIGATIYVKELSDGATSNEYGFYSITLPAGSYTVQSSYIGYTTQSTTVELSRNINFNVELAPEADQLEEVVITGEAERPRPARWK